jgi:hypothetical protein
MADISSLIGAVGDDGTIGKAIVQLELDSTKYTTKTPDSRGPSAAEAMTHELAERCRSIT